MREGARDQLEQDVRGLYAEGIMPDVISRITKTSIDTARRFWVCSQTDFLHLHEKAVMTKEIGTRSGICRFL